MVDTWSFKGLAGKFTGTSPISDEKIKVSGEDFELNQSTESWMGVTETAAGPFLGSNGTSTWLVHTLTWRLRKLGCLVQRINADPRLYIVHSYFVCTHPYKITCT